MQTQRNREKRDEGERREALFFCFVCRLIFLQLFDFFFFFLLLGLWPSLSFHLGTNLTCFGYIMGGSTSRKFASYKCEYSLGIHIITLNENTYHEPYTRWKITKNSCHMKPHIMSLIECGVQFMRSNKKWRITP